MPCHSSALSLHVVDNTTRSGSRTAATSKMERFVTVVNSFQPLTTITKRSILDVAAVLDPPLTTYDATEDDKFFKIRPIIEALRNNCVKIEPEEYQSPDE